MTKVPDVDALPKDSASWLHSLGMDHYAGTLAKHGFESLFAVGLLTSPELLSTCGVWIDDATLIFLQIQAPRLLVQRWSPMISRIPTNTTVERFLQTTPVPLLAVRAVQLAENGFDCLAALKNATYDDCLSIQMPIGHALALHHVALLMNDPGTMPKTIAISLSEWLANLSPPMGHYVELIRLERPDVQSVESLLTMKREEVMRLLVSLGHRKTLWSYIVRARSYWLDSL